MMNHQTANEWLLDLHVGRLDGPLRGEVTEHVAECGDCRELLSTYDVVSAALAVGDPGEAHVEIEVLVELAIAPDSVSAAQRSTIERHLESCAACRDELEAVRDAESIAAARPHLVAIDGALSDGAPSTARRRVARPERALPWRRAAYLASGIAAMLLVAVGFYALREVPRAERQIAELRSRVDGLQQRVQASGSPLGAIGLPLFRGALRGDEQLPTIEVAAGDAAVPLALAPTIPAATSAADRYRIEVRDADDRLVHELTLTAGRMRELSSQSGALAVLVPGAALAGGRHRVSVRAVSGDGVLLDQPFDVVRQQPSDRGDRER